jgi:hypothetical protein
MRLQIHDLSIAVYTLIYVCLKTNSYLPTEDSVRRVLVKPENQIGSTCD